MVGSDTFVLFGNRLAIYGVSNQGLTRSILIVIVQDTSNASKDLCVHLPFISIIREASKDEVKFRSVSNRDIATCDS